MTALEVISKGYNAIEFRGEQLKIQAGDGDVLFVTRENEKKLIPLKVSDVEKFITIPGVNK